MERSGRVAAGGTAGPSGRATSARRGHEESRWLTRHERRRRAWTTASTTPRRTSTRSTTRRRLRRPRSRAARARRRPAWRRRTAIEMVISGALGLLASFVLSIDALKLAADPNAGLSCNVNQVIDCGKVRHDLAGAPARRVLPQRVPRASRPSRWSSRSRWRSSAASIFPRWFMLSAQAIYTVGFVFAWWLFAQSYFVIHALCPWCLLITVTTTLVWAGLTRINVRDGAIDLGVGRSAVRRRRQRLVRHHRRDRAHGRGDRAAGTGRS